MMNYLKTPKIQLAITLLLIYITSLFNNFSVQNISIFIVCTITCITSDLLFLFIRKKPLFFPSAALVTGLILGIVASPNLSVFELVLISVLAIASKNFLKIQGRHIFNPAAFGLIIGSFFFEHTVSWWATSWQQFTIYHISSIIYFLILLTPALISQFRMRRFRITLSFLLAYNLFQIILNTKYTLLNTILDPTILFFSLVILPEPITTPNNHTRQIIFGTIVAFSTLLFSFPILGIRHDPLLLALLIGNLLFFKFR